MNDTSGIIGVSDLEPQSYYDDSLESQHFAVQNPQAKSQSPSWESSSLSELYNDMSKLYTKLFEHYVAIVCLTVALWILLAQLLSEAVSRALRPCAKAISKLLILTFTIIPISYDSRESFEHMLRVASTRYSQLRVHPARWVLKRYHKAAVRLQNSQTASEMELTERLVHRHPRDFPASYRPHTTLETPIPPFSEISPLRLPETEVSRLNSVKNLKARQEPQQSFASNVATNQLYPEAMDVVNLSGSWTTARAMMSNNDGKSHSPSISEPLNLPLSGLQDTSFPIGQLPVSAPKTRDPESDPRTRSTSPSHTGTSTNAASINGTPSAPASRDSYLQATSTPTPTSTSQCTTLDQHQLLFWDAWDTKDVEERRQRLYWSNSNGSIKLSSASEMGGPRDPGPIRRGSKIPRRVA